MSPEYPLKDVLKWISTEIAIVILIPGIFLTTYLLELFNKDNHLIVYGFIPEMKLILFFLFALVLGWTTHFFALEIYSFLVKTLDKVRNGEYPSNMKVYRNFFANLSLTLPPLLGVIFNRITTVISLILLFIITLRIYIQCENAKK